MNSKADIETRKGVDIMRKLLTESEENTNVGDEKTDMIPYTKNDDLFKKMIQEAVDWFGASFTKSKSPLLYDPSNDDVILSGEVRSLNNAVFQFKYRSGNNCIFLWTNELSLTDDVVKTISRINGAGNNWMTYLNNQNGDYKPISARDNGDDIAKPLNENVGMVRGDDLPSPKRGVVRGDDI